MEGEDIYEEYTDTRGKVHKMVVGFKPKQSATYEMFLKRGEFDKARMLYMDTIRHPRFLRNQFVELIELKYQSEDFAEEQMKITLTKKKRKRFSLGNFLFGDW